MESHKDTPKSESFMSRTHQLSLSDGLGWSSEGDGTLSRQPVVFHQAREHPRWLQMVSHRTAEIRALSSIDNFCQNS